MFIVSGQVKRETTIWSTDVPLRQLGDQEFNIVDCAKTMTKYAHMKILTAPRPPQEKTMTNDSTASLKARNSPYSTMDDAPWQDFAIRKMGLPGIW